MANNLAGLNPKLATQLRDAAYGTWVTGEMDELLTESVNSLWPRYSRELDPTTTTITLVTATYFYALPAGVMAISRLDFVDSGGGEFGPVFGRAWELVGNPLLGTAKLHIGPVIVESGVGGTVRILGYGKYDVTTNLIPDDYIQLVLARARAEAYRRIASDRVRFKEWLARNQTQNVSVNELLQLINEADNEINRLTAQAPRVWQRPVPGSTG